MNKALPIIFGILTGVTAGISLKDTNSYVQAPKVEIVPKDGTIVAYPRLNKGIKPEIPLKSYTYANNISQKCIRLYK